ncbi:MAG: S8 family serine peptidase [FCB group bacterium]|nr:S8 family serine peptidase [FCB group bacterium]MBL7027116.1 S8 family serine peptidase [Candidatus Neomarinimicrobiota bacterium]MBL7122430.1 S8 family serine peptidase [Candidatus Neomarinimicrobiota bacterium]
MQPFFYPSPDRWRGHSLYNHNTITAKTHIAFLPDFFYLHRDVTMTLTKKDLFPMRLSPPRYIALICVLLFCQPSYGQNQVELITDKFFLKVQENSFYQSQRSSTLQVMDLPGVGDILSAQNTIDIAPAFTSFSMEDNDPYGLERIFVVHITEDEDVLAVIDELNALSDVEYAEAMYIRELYDTQMTPNDAYFSQSWHHPMVSTPDAWDIQTGSDTVVIAIIDTGVDTDHPDLMGNLWINPGEIADNFIDDDLNGKVDDIYGWNFTDGDANVNHEWGWHPYNAEDHGTHCAGIASGVTNNLIGIAGASQNSKIMTCKIFPYTTDVAAANAIIYAAENGAHVISNSWGGGGASATIGSAILHARNTKGSIVLFASGNDGSSSPHYPGASAGAVCVGATNSSDGRASFSNYGSWVDVCAPGTNIWSCTDPANPAHNSEYQAWDGTSMATPLAAGIAALIKSQFPSITVDALEARLIDGDDVGNLQMGFRVNALKALTSFNVSHTALANVIDPVDPIEVNVETFAEAGSSLSLILNYSISGGGYSSIDMQEVLPNNWSSEIPSPESGSIVEYYIHASDDDGNVVYHPHSAPETPHFFLVGSSGFFPTLIYEDAETEQGWSLGVAGDDATAGMWIRDEPIGTFEGTDPVQPEEDHSLVGTKCFVTGNAPFDGSNTGAGDVDGGRTTLESPVYAIPPGVSPVISYWRWYSNDLGFSPGEDSWIVQARDQNNIWINLEQTTTSDNSWTQHQFLVNHFFDQANQLQFRFIAEDAPGGSLVEAAVDDLHIFYTGEVSFTPGDVNFDTQINIQDLILIVAHILGNSTLQGNAALAADFNLDATVNIQDVVTLVATILD